MVDSSNKRLTVDIPADEHRHLKMLCTQLGVTMRDFVIQAVAAQLEQYEDEMDLRVAEEARRRVESGEDKLISWEEMEKRLGWDEL